MKKIVAALALAVGSFIPAAAEPAEPRPLVPDPDFALAAALGCLDRSDLQCAERALLDLPPGADPQDSVLLLVRRRLARATPAAAEADSIGQAGAGPHADADAANPSSQPLSPSGYAPDDPRLLRQVRIDRLELDRARKALSRRRFAGTVSAAASRAAALGSQAPSEIAETAPLPPQQAAASAEPTVTAPTAARPMVALELKDGTRVALRDLFFRAAGSDGTLQAPLPGAAFSTSRGIIVLKWESISKLRILDDSANDPAAGPLARVVLASGEAIQLGLVRGIVTGRRPNPPGGEFTTSVGDLAAIELLR